MNELQAAQELDETFALEAGQFDDRDVICDCGSPMKCTESVPDSYYQTGWQIWECTNRDCYKHAHPEVRG